MKYGFVWRSRIYPMNTAIWNGKWGSNQWMERVFGGSTWPNYTMKENYANLEGKSWHGGTLLLGIVGSWNKAVQKIGSFRSDWQTWTSRLWLERSANLLPVYLGLNILNHLTSSPFPRSFHRSLTCWKKLPVNRAVWNRAPSTGVLMDMASGMKSGYRWSHR